MPVFVMDIWKRKGGVAPVAHTPPSCRELYRFLGQAGKENRPFIGLCSLAIATAGLVGCDIPGRVSRHLGAGETLPVYGLEGRWAGPVTPANPACGKPTNGIMSIGIRGFGFDPFGSTVAITGTVEKGALEGTLTRPGGGNTLSITFTGQAHETAEGNDVIEGTLASGRCTWTVMLRRA